ncbi:MAG: 5'/3'-nucleotidase SurE, partial [Bacteroidales bacterium]|nr:5'/3'-nucleotidase SurE [Bacteroidales bacterium]
QAMGCWQEEFEKRKDPAGKTYYWLTGRFINHEPDSTDTDEWALRNGYVSVVPVSTDMTAHSFISILKTKL